MIPIKYLIFSIFAISVNLAAQLLFFVFYEDNYSIYIGIFIGTILGLITKYILDKNYILKHLGYF